MQTLKPVLVVIQYDNTAPLSKGFLPIERVTEVDPSSCRPACQLEGEDEWIIYTHLRADGLSGNAQLALRLDSPALINECQAAISPTKDGPWEHLRRYPDRPASEETPAYFLLPTRFGRKDKDGNRRPLPSPADNITIAGMQFLHICAPGEKEKTVRLCTYPSSVSAKDYRLILEDVALVHQQLLLGRGSHKSMSVGERYEKAALDVGKQVARMKAILHRLEAAPERELIAVPSRAPSHKVKKLTAKTLMDQAAGKRLLRTEIHEESFDIYEHRMIRTYLENLKTLVGRYRKIEQQDRNALAGELISGQAQKAAQIQLDSIIRRLLPDSNQPSAQSPEHPYPRKRLYLRARGVPGIGGIESKMLTVSCISRTGWQIVFCDSNNLNAPLDQLNMPTHGNGWQVLFFLRCLKELKKRWEMDWGYLDVILTGRFAVSYYQQMISSQEEEETRCVITIEELECVEIQNVGVLRPQDVFPGPQTDERLIKYIKENPDGAIPDGKDELFYHTSLINRINFQKSGLPKPHDWDKLEQQINQLLASPVLRGVGSGERLHTSNLFAKHRNYSRAYRLMRENQAQFDGIEPWKDGSLLIDASHQIYELWCLLKMLSIWINDYGFTLKTPSINELVRQLIEHLHSSKQTVDPIVLLMEHGNLAGMKLQLDYDQDCWFEEDGEERVLRPDYFLTITYGSTYRFCMDAKYRNYASDQMTRGAWYDDLIDVALRKYICRLGSGLKAKENEKIDGSCILGSYILHSDFTSRDRCGGQQIGRYFWSRFGKDPVLDQLPPELRETKDCRFGSICFTPLGDGAPDAAFRGLMQMIMEHFLGKNFAEKMYRKKCWICGNEEMGDPKELPTIRGTKYHIVCPRCKEFWVENHCYSCRRQKLGKHLHNYYRVQNNSIWNVVCPACGAKF